MTVNYGAKPVFARFDGLGAAALSRFSTDPSDFSQTVSQVNADPSVGAQTVYKVALTIKLSDGISVKVNLESKGNSLALQVNSSARMSAADRAALARLANGFQNAIDGMGNAVQPDFDGLLQYDPSLVSSIDLQATTQANGALVQKQTFHADRTTRSFSADGPDGQVNISVDLRQQAIMGNAQRRKAGLDAYLKQFQEAGARGHANGATLATFTAAFQQLTYQPSSETSVSSLPINLSDDDHALLSALPDFNASMTDTPTSPNPMRPGERDTFSYQVSQQTLVGGRDQANRAISQHRHAHLEASFHEPLTASPLALDDTRASQNYYFKHVSEDRVSDTRISYQNGLMIGATADEHVSRSTQVLKYVMGILTEDSTTPESSDTRRDLLTQPRLG
ncbi:hypothetical protein FHW58_000756 [Duganella sp. 1224]|uniref:hypothetical protein n=1 Tax=Duganella sp. 1224 TaxID=2587052 RepID=UPI0015CB11B3|nr:hypothetical protein [Duganella sp. 1224]NYE59604.1 hypothetical protein [Duganella sp. 1224]